MDDCAEWPDRSAILHNNITIPTKLLDIEFNYYHE